MVNLSYENRNKDFRKENIKSLQKIVPTPNDYQAGQNYETFMKSADERLRKSGHKAPADNIISIILEELLKLNKQL